jgi:hypothetical protein
MFNFSKFVYIDFGAETLFVFRQSSISRIKFDIIEFKKMENAMLLEGKNIRIRDYKVSDLDDYLQNPIRF